MTTTKSSTPRVRRHSQQLQQAGNGHTHLANYEVKP